MKSYDYCIWDFNGTILDDVDACISSVNPLLRERGLPTLDTVEEYRGVFRFPVIEYYKAIGFDFEKESYEALAPAWVALYLENVKSATIYSDVIATLDTLKKMGVKQIVLSATENSMLEKQLRGLGIYEYFDDVLGLDNIHAVSKIGAAKAWREAHPDACAILIGDTDHDMETAEVLGADCVLVCRGHQTREYLEGKGAEVCDDLSEVLAKKFA